MNGTGPESKGIPLDPAAETKHLTPDGKLKPIRRKKVTTYESTLPSLPNLTPVIRPPESLIRKPRRTRRDIGSLNDTED